jgi:hypothetical protein
MCYSDFPFYFPLLSFLSVFFVSLVVQAAFGTCGSDGSSPCHHCQMLQPHRTGELDVIVAVLAALAQK